MITIFKKYKINEEYYYNDNADYEYQWKNEILTAIYKDSRYNEDIKLVKDLVLNKKVNINCKETDKQGYEYSPLLLSIRLIDNGHIYLWSDKIAFFLINNGADVNLANYFGTTPLMNSTALGEINIVKKLIKCNATIDLQDKDGNTAFHVSLDSPRYGIHVDLINELIKAGADWFIENNKGETPYKLMKKNLSDYYIKNYIAKECPEQYDNAMMIVNAKKYNL